MKIPSSSVVHIACLGLLTTLAPVFAGGGPDGSSDYSRAGRWELGLPGKYWMGNDIIKNALGTGFMVGYNFDEHWNVNLEGYCGIRLETEVDGIDGSGSIYTAIVNLEYYFKPGKFSPYLTASTGFFNYDTKEDFNGSSAFSEVESGFSYGGGAGVRWAYNDHWFIKGSYHAFGTTTDGAKFMHGPEITIGYQF
ncbi:MAG TPA: outer membrane beta-barrel protein [Verrucomicrobiota bacterium]|nr:outer membrane beta-barrel protein [Verrucomicrobiota bacterium]